MVMPSEGYQFMTDQEVAAFIAGDPRFPENRQSDTRRAPRSDGPHRACDSASFVPRPTLVADISVPSRFPISGPQFALGRHIVEVNCSECHGPDLKGQEVEPGVVSADLAIAGAYDVEQFRTLLRDGRGAGRQGPWTDGPGRAPRLQTSCATTKSPASTPISPSAPGVCPDRPSQLSAPIAIGASEGDMH